MSKQHEPTVELTQLSYARFLGVAVMAGFALLGIGFILYVTGLLPSSTPVGEIPDLWHLSAEELATATSRKTGWSWIANLRQGDIAAFAALVYFPASTLILVFIAGILYARNRVASYATIAVLEGIVLLIAATGLLSGGQ